MPQPAASNANEYIEGQLREGLAEIEKKLNADALVFCGPIAPGADDVIRRAVEQRSSRR
jgi:molybdopterin biosynthesis enzyme